MFDEDINQIIARSKPFDLKNIVEKMGDEGVWEAEEPQNIHFNNLLKPDSDVINNESYSKKFIFALYKVTRLRRLSLFEFFSKSVKSVVPVLGIDFSDSNWSYCEGDILHSQDEDKPQIYAKLIKMLSETISFISIDYIYPYLFGCKLK